MKIKEWEEFVYKKYGAKKIDNFLELKSYLTNPLNYAHNFSPEEVTETEIMNDEYYASYVFDENKIAGRSVISVKNSGWKTTIVIISSLDHENISNWALHTSNGLTIDEFDNFCTDVNPLKN